MLGELGISRGRAIRYTVLPQIMPRIGRFFTSGLAGLPYFIMVVFNTVRIIPNGHPFLRRENHGKYSVFRALAEAANHITFDRKNIDKVTFFALILAGFVALLLQFALCIIALVALPAYAADGGYDSSQFFGNKNPESDIAFRMLDLVFGIPGIFTGNAETTPFHLALHALFRFYSFGIMLIGVFVIIYLITCVVLETAESGVPFGQRFNKAWAPVRLILFFGLLLPTPNGINLAQYIVLNAARLGSNVATNGWLTFDKAAKTPYMGSSEQLVARPNVPGLESFISYMMLARTCSWAEGRINGRDIKPYAVFEPGEAGALDLDGSTPAFADLVKKSAGGTIFIRFGEKDKDKYVTEKGAVFPYCGELAIPVVDQAQPGSAVMQQAYIDQIICLWSGRSGAASECSNGSFSDLGRDFTERYSVLAAPNKYPDMTPYVGDMQKTQFLINVGGDIDRALDKAVQKQIAEGDWNNDAPLKMGWAGAGIWFNKIAQQNGALTSATFGTPSVRKMPYVMELVYKTKIRQDPNVPVEEAYTPTTSKGVIPFDSPQERDVAVILNQVYQYYGSENASSHLAGVKESTASETTGNIIVDSMNLVLGTSGLFDMCKNTNVHPLAQLSSVGKGLVDHSIRGFGVAAGIGVGGGLLSLLSKQNFTATIQGATKFFMTFAGLGLILGFVLYYVLPFLPFIYFFFAVMTWVKGIFEAMVGLPLWALAHLRIDGEGMPGDAAESGYFYILEIFLRPICILIGFLGGILIFAAMVKVLNQIFYLVLSNLTGHHIETGSTGCFQAPGGTIAGAADTGAGTEGDYKRGVMDEFFYTVVYAIIVYMIALPCFKLVDLIPDTIMRWLNSGVQSFGANDGDPAENMMSYVTQGAGVIGQKLSQGGKGFGFFN